MNNPQNMGALFDQEEARAIEQFKATPPEQLRAEGEARAARLEADAKRTPTETSQDEDEDEEPTE
jgi:hypothetical protein